MYNFTKTKRAHTLIELLSVIVILSLLSATVLPKFIHVSRNAKIAQVTAIANAMKSTNHLLRTKLLLNGHAISLEFNNQVTFSIDGQGPYEFIGGYPETYSEAHKKYYFQLLDIPTPTDLSIRSDGAVITGRSGPWHLRGSNSSIQIGYGANILGQKCYAEYRHQNTAEDIILQKVSLVTEGCT